MKHASARDVLGKPVQERFAEREVTILFADLRGFTELTASHPVGVVLEALNRRFVAMSEVIVAHQGTIDKFMGDSFMAVFFARPDEPGEDARRAVACAVDMQLRLEALNVARGGRGIPELYAGIGINTGKVMAGLLGSEHYSVYTVIGEEVNLTSRIEAFSLRGQVLVSESTHERCAGFAETGEPVEVYVKGRPQRVCLREVLALPGLGKKVPRRDARRSARVEVRLPFTYQVLEGKIVAPQTRAGVILDIGYHGVLVDVGDAQIERLAELKLETSLPLFNYPATDVYARVVNSREREGRRLLGLEFTSLGRQTNEKIRLFVQMLIQGGDDSSAGRAR